MKILNIKLIQLFSLLIISSPTSLCIKAEGNEILKKLKFTNSININSHKISKDSFRKVLLEDKIGLSSILANLIESDQKQINKSKKSELEIESDIQYQIDSVFFAEGNVILNMSNGIVKTDKLIYDKENKFIKAEGNVIFERGDQFFKASNLEYNFLDKKGFVENIYGTLNFKNFQRDLNLKNESFKTNNEPKKKYDLNNLPTDISLIEGGEVSLKNKLSLNAFDFDFSKIKNWRFKSEKINIYQNSWDSELIFFTNDPYNNPQLIVKSKNFSGEIVENKTILKSKSTFINIDNKITLPIGSRTIQDAESKSTWGFGYEKEYKDGIYISRNFNEVNFNDNFQLNFSPYFLLQRALQNKSYLFRAENSKIASPNVESEVHFLDYFAIDSNLKGQILGWDLSIDTISKTINPEKYHDAISSDINLTRNIFGKGGYSLDVGIYGAFEKENIYTSIGSKIITNYVLESENSERIYNVNFDISKHNAISRRNKNILIDLERYSISSSFTHNYRIFTNNEDDLIYDESFKFIPTVLGNGIFLVGNISAGYSQYSDNSYQSIIQYSFGPKIVLGNFKRKFFDYTMISAIPEFSFKEGRSPFKFDDFKDKQRIKIQFDQQLIGPLVFGLKTTMNIDSESSKYGEFKKFEYKLGINRRAYSFSLDYDPDPGSILFKINVFNFDGIGLTPKF